MERDKKMVKSRIKKSKELLLVQLAKTSIVQLGCERTDIARATYYRWRKTDRKFAKAADAAIQEGALLVNDLAESQLLSAIADKNMTAIIFWLKHHHCSYETRIELRQSFGSPDEKLTPKQEEVIRKAMEYTIIELPEIQKEDTNEKEDKD